MLITIPRRSWVTLIMTPGLKPTKDVKCNFLEAGKLNKNLQQMIDTSDVDVEITPMEFRLVSWAVEYTGCISAEE